MRQIKIARGSATQCRCGCGMRKTSPRRRYAPGHDSRTSRRKLFRNMVEEKSVPKVLQERAKRDAQRGVFPGLGRKEGNNVHQ